MEGIHATFPMIILHERSIYMHKTTNADYFQHDPLHTNENQVCLIMCESNPGVSNHMRSLIRSSCFYIIGQKFNL